MNTDDDPILFKAQIFALTGVQPERQKVVCKGVTLRDDSWGQFKLTNVSDIFVTYTLIAKDDYAYQTRFHQQQPFL